MEAKMAGKAETVARIKAMGLSCTMVHGEYRFTIPLADVRDRHPEYDYNQAMDYRESLAYYTDCSEDALATAARMESDWINFGIIK